jgi:uncharacterized tellurite resistance protein B-like protein
MGLFDKLARKKAESPLTPTEAVGVLLYLTVAADGDISLEERDAYIATTDRMKIFQGQTPDQFNLMIDKAKFLLADQGFERAIEKIAAVLPPELRETAFVWATEMVFADGSVGDEESGLLAAVHEAFGIDEELALKVAEVMQMKYRG